jgi:RHS repeat-associated protein
VITIKNSRLSLVQSALLALLTMFITGSAVVAQTTAARPDRGTMPGASYSVSDIENISLTNGNVNLSIPLASLPPIAGGKLKFTLSAVYNSKLWNDTRSEQQNPPYAGCQSWVVNTPQLSELGGWTINGAYRIEVRDAHEDVDYVVPDPPPAQSCELDANEQNRLQNRWYRTVLITPDGAEHELRPSDSTYQPYGIPAGNHPFLFNYYKDTPNTINAPMRYYSFDGSYLYVIINPSTSSTLWTIYLNDGTRVTQTSSGIQRITDTNGNSIKIQGGAYQDEQTGRQITYSYDPAGNGGHGQGHVQYQTVTGTWETIDINFDTTTVQGKVYRVDAWNPLGGEFGNGGTCFHDQAMPATGVTVIRQIVFPQTEPNTSPRSFSFSYDSDVTASATDQVTWSCGGQSENYTRTASKGMGALSQITTPSGAVIDYSYSRDNTHRFLDADLIPRETITQKQVTHDGTTDTWTYVIDESGGTGGEVTAPDGSVSTETKYPQGPAGGMLFGENADKAGLVYRSNKSDKVLVERHWTAFAFTGANTRSTGSDSALATFNPQVDAEYTSLLDETTHNPVKMSAKTYQYDYNGNLLQEKDYDWFDPSLVTRGDFGVPNGVPAGATVLRTISNTYYNGASSADSANVYAKRSLSAATPLILNALQQTTLGPSITQLSYDNQAYGTAPTVGNLTSQSVWDDVDNKWITSSQTYGLYGNLATKTDARTKVTQFFYDDPTHALPTRVVVDPQNSSGEQTTTTAFDYSTGLVTSQTDPNGNVSTIDYTNQLLGTVDPFGRPGVTIGPLVNAGGTDQHHRTTTTYFDSARQLVVASDLSSENDKLLKSRTTSDMLGRVIKVEQSEDGSSYTISSLKDYEQMGRITYSSNPARSAGGSTDGWTRTTTDVLGRVIEVATFGGTTKPASTGSSGIFTGSVITSYDANFTTVTDQNGKIRRSMVDGLGRLVRVDEPDANNSLGTTLSPAQPTSYTYDVFGNLRIVTQGSQTRTFTYDSLSHLRSALNPESGTISYAYDDNGNLTQKTDARPVTTTYVYDALNRPTSRSYSDGTPAVTYSYDSATKGKGRLASVSSSVSTYSYASYDGMGRASGMTQTLGGQSYSASYIYGLAGQVLSTTYPSGRTVTSTYDNAGRQVSVAGNLGDGTQRSYSTGIVYSPTGSMTKERFDTATPIYNKLFYNSRGQLSEIRESTSYTSPTDTTWNRGAIINHYSDSCWGMCWDTTNGSQSMTNNNGNLKKQEVYIPLNEQLQNAPYTTWYQQYDYDSLNRLQRVHEYTGSTQTDWQQEYVYDRYGNRTISGDVTKTYGLGVNNVQTSVSSATNRMYGPGETDSNHPLVDYDAAGNQTKDLVTAPGVVNGTRVYDAENRMTIARDINSNQVAAYSYDADGRRVKRTVGSQSSGVETWQVYGLGGELLAEYAANASAASPQKEYGYRNGQLLITAERSAGQIPAGVNVAAAANGASASASSVMAAQTAGNAINGDRKGLNSSWWTDNTSFAYPDWIEVDFAGVKTINEIDVFGLQQNPSSPVEPTAEMTSSYALTSFAVQYWTGSAWVTVPDGTISGNNKVWNKLSFAALSTSKIRVQVSNVAGDNHSQVVELEAYAAPNVAAAANGASASASSVMAAQTAGNAINGDHKGLSSAWWTDNTSFAYPDWIEVDFAGVKTINEIDVFGLQQNPSSPVEPTAEMTSSYALTSFAVQYWTGSAWATVPDGTISGNNKVWNKLSFAALSTSKIRVQVTNVAGDNHSQVVEVEAYGPGGSAAELRWLVTDQLGTPRMVFDQSGSLATVKRHDYAPFGEELFNGARTPALGYGASDGVRQQFTSKERDNETGLDYFEARYYASVQGRFTSPDAPFADQEQNDPQSWNLYTYVRNNPLRYIDPFGDAHWEVQADGEQHYVGDEDGEYDKDLNAVWVADGQYWNFQEDPTPVEVVGNACCFMTVTKNGEFYSVVEYQIPEPMIGGGLKNIARKAGPGLFARYAPKIAEWLGFGKKTLPLLAGATGKEMLRDAMRIVKSSGGTAAEKADLFEKLSIQIMERTGSSWMAVRSAGTDGSAIFIGKASELLIVSPSGQLFKGTVQAGGVQTGAGGILTPIYEALRRVD